MRKAAFLLLATVLLTACNANPPDSAINENEVIEGQVTVNFLSAAVQWSTEDVVTKNKEYYLQHEPDIVKQDATQTPDTYLAGLYAKDDSGKMPLNFWKVGTIGNGTYAGQTLVLATQNCEGPCPIDVFRYAVDESANHWTALLPYSSGDIASYVGGPANDQEASIDIPALDFPQALDLYSSDQVMIADPFSQQDPDFFNLDGKEATLANYTISTDKVEQPFKRYLLLKGHSCVFAETADGMWVQYQTMPQSFGFMPGAKGAQTPQPLTAGDFTLSLKEGGTETHTYNLFAGGCGFSSSCLQTYAADSTDEANIVELGTIQNTTGPSSTPETVYTVKSFTEGMTGNSVTQAVSAAYDTYKMGLTYKDPPETAMSTAVFLSRHEVVLLKLDSGAYALAYDTAVAPAVECGKPVIYLYPTKAEQVSVKVNNITFTKTVPTYGNGWTVWADPTGALKNLADGKTYPYLFWEGQSSARVTMGQPWTLAKKDIATKLPVALTSMGLSTQESADFMEFWLPKLQAVTTPYVQFNFEGTAAMNQVAPLTITPAPDTLLRVFMYYQGVSAAGRPMPAYTAPARSGFTAIEWGGSLY